MPFAGRLLAAVLMLACGAVHAAEPGQDPLTTPKSPLYQPSPEVRAQVREVMGQGQRTQRPAPAPVLADDMGFDPAALGGEGSDTPVPRGLISVAQRELAAYGYDPGPVDGRLGPRTRKALMAFQTDKGLPADGRLTFDLLSKLMVRAAPEVAAPPPPPPPAPPPVASFKLGSVLGKTVHAQSGDLLGHVNDFVVGADGVVTGMVVATTNGYGTDEGKAVVPFAMVGHAVTRAAVILPLSAEKALPLRDKAQKTELAAGQWLLSSAGEDAMADTDGKLLAGVAQAPK